MFAMRRLVLSGALMRCIRSLARRLLPPLRAVIVLAACSLSVYLLLELMPMIVERMSEIGKKRVKRRQHPGRRIDPILAHHLLIVEGNQGSERRSRPVTRRFVSYALSSRSLMIPVMQFDCKYLAGAFSPMCDALHSAGRTGAAMASQQHFGDHA